MVMNNIYVYYMLLHDIYQRQTGLEELLPPVRFRHLAKLRIENKVSYLWREQHRWRKPPKGLV